MVSFILVEETDAVAIYNYYPQAEETNESGVITLFKKTGTFEITRLAPDDFSRRVTLEEVKSLRDSVNNVRVEEGEPELTEEEGPTPTEGFITTFYADHVISTVRKSFERGVLPKKGSAAWY